MLQKTKGRRTLGVYKSYNFIDKDPIIDYARTKVFANGGPSKMAKASGVTSTTLYNWFKGKTRRPQFATVAAVLLACGESQLDLRKIRRG
jgi:DNA-binding phage protein